MGQLQFMDALVSVIIMIKAQVLFERMDSAIGTQGKVSQQAKEQSSSPF